MVLVVYVGMWSDRANPDDYRRKNDVEAHTEEYQWMDRIPNTPLYEKYGYLEIRS